MRICTHRIKTQGSPKRHRASGNPRDGKMIFSCVLQYILHSLNFIFIYLIMLRHHVARRNRKLSAQHECAVSHLFELESHTVCFPQWNCEQVCFFSASLTIMQSVYFISRNPHVLGIFAIFRWSSTEA